MVGRWEGSSTGPTVHFNSHIDVVEPGIGWTYDPFAAEVMDDRIYGRGACDMKGGLALLSLPSKPSWNWSRTCPAASEISGTADEETGGYGGVAYLSEQGYFSPPRVDHVIIPEPLNKDRVCLGHRGVWWAEIETHGALPTAPCRFSATRPSVT